MRKRLFILVVAKLVAVAILAVEVSAQEEVSRALKTLIAKHDGKVAVAIRVLDNNNNLLDSWDHRGREVMPTASLIKLPVMVEAYQQASEALVSLDEMVTLRDQDRVSGSGILSEHFSAGANLCLRDLIRLMIRYSDNTATNLVLDRIGIATTNQTMAKLGFPETRINSMVYRRDTSVDLERSKQFGLGSTTAIDMVELIVKIERAEVVSPPACSAMLDHLLNCDDAGRFPRFLPPGTKVAQKTGAVSRTRTAAGVIYGADRKIVLCVLTDDNADASWSNDNDAHLLCANLAKAAFDFVAVKRSTGTARPLAVGDSGTLVEAVQRTLNSRISSELDIDGDFGPATEAAVRQFQEENQLTTTGIVDSSTWSALGELVEDEPVPPPEVVNSRVPQRSPPLNPLGPPSVTSKAYAVIDVKTGKVLASKQGNVPLPNASTTKIMTALLVLDYAQEHPECMSEIITFSKRADDTGGSTSGIRADEQVQVSELLYGLLLPSGNDASVALAEHFGHRLLNESPKPTSSYDLFIQAMNERADELGLKETHFENPHGLTVDGHYSSAMDLARLSRVALGLPSLKDYVSCSQHAARVTSTAGYSRNVLWTNTNQLLKQQGFLGMKTGTTSAAGACLIAFGEREDFEIVVVVLGAANSSARYVDARNLFAWGWRKRDL